MIAGPRNQPTEWMTFWRTCGWFFGLLCAADIFRTFPIAPSAGLSCYVKKNQSRDTWREYISTHSPRHQDRKYWKVYMCVCMPIVRHNIGELNDAKEGVRECANYTIYQKYILGEVSKEAKCSRVVCSSGCSGASGNSISRVYRI